MKDKLLIDCRDVSLGYEGHAIGSHLNFQVHSGEYLCIVGENGSGKSTLLKCLLGLLKPMAGEVVLDSSLRHGAIGYLPQQTPVQRDFPASVQEIVISGCISKLGFRPFYSKKEKELAQLKKDKANQQKVLDSLYPMVEMLQEQVNILQKESNALKAQIADVEQNIKDAERQINAIQAKIDECI